MENDSVGGGGGGEEEKNVSKGANKGAKAYTEEIDVNLESKDTKNDNKDDYKKDTENEEEKDNGDIDKNKIKWFRNVNWTSVLNNSIEKMKNKEEKKHVSANIGLSNKKKKKLRSVSYSEFENKNKNKNKLSELENKNKNVLRLIVDLDEEVEDSYVDDNGNKYNTDNRSYDGDNDNNYNIKNEYDGKNDIRNDNEKLIGVDSAPQTGFLEVDIESLEYDLIWSESNIKRHKLLTRIICDWLDLLVTFEYL
jgi:hypothetical protein